SVRFMNAIFYTRAFTIQRVIAAWMVLFYLAVRNRDRRLMLLWVWVIVTPLPVALLPDRGGGCLYIVVAGWAIVAAILCECLARGAAREPLFRRIPSSVVVTCLLTGAAYGYVHKTTWYRHFVEEAYLHNDGFDKTWDLIQQFRTLRT